MACKHQALLLRQEKKKSCELEVALGKSRREEIDPVRTDRWVCITGSAVLQGPGSSHSAQAGTYHVQAGTWAE